MIYKLFLNKVLKMHTNHPLKRKTHKKSTCRFNNLKDNAFSNVPKSILSKQV